MLQIKGAAGRPRSTGTVAMKKSRLPTFHLNLGRRMLNLAVSIGRQETNFFSSIVAQAATSLEAFPRDYEELLEQVRTATAAALKNSKMLLEIEFPTAGLDSVSGDAEGGIEMSTSMLLVREFCRVFSGETASRTRINFARASGINQPCREEFLRRRKTSEHQPFIVRMLNFVDRAVMTVLLLDANLLVLRFKSEFSQETCSFCGFFCDRDHFCKFFPDVREVESARKNVFEGTSYKLDYLTKPSGLEDFGFGKKEKIADHVQSFDAVFVAAYPYFNVNEMIAVEELYKDSAEATGRPIVVFNGELDRIRSGYYPSFFYPKLGALAKSFIPKFETVYYIHNFKGRFGGTLFRVYPGPWQVLRKVDCKYVCIHQQETMPTLKEVALDILPAHTTSK